MSELLGVPLCENVYALRGILIQKVTATMDAELTELCKKTAPPVFLLMLCPNLHGRAV